MFTHTGCGGVLIPIEHPVWWSAATRDMAVMVARCNRCGRAGEIAGDYDRKELWRGLRVKEGLQ